MAKTFASSLVDRVYEYLLDQIISGAIRYGDTISIKGVAGRLSVSSMPVREALKRLEFEGVVDIRPRSSCAVRVPSRKTILEVYALREALEVFALSSCEGHVPRASLARMEGIVARMQGLGDERDPLERERKAIALDREFHSEICALAGNDLLNAMYRQLSLRVNMTLMHEKTFHTMEKDWADMHADVLSCLQADPPRAVDLLKSHFASATEIWRKNGEGRQGGSPSDLSAQESKQEHR
ncbi:MAG: GntR family transcriptional regulator [Spirochaetia bacterium]|jgi:DNA-binding GntR family transcriptional regulator